MIYEYICIKHHCLLNFDTVIMHIPPRGKCLRLKNFEFKSSLSEVCALVFISKTSLSEVCALVFISKTSLSEVCALVLLDCSKQLSIAHPKGGK